MGGQIESVFARNKIIEHMKNLSFIKKVLYENIIRHLMNRNVNKIRCLIK